MGHPARKGRKDDVPLVHFEHVRSERLQEEQLRLQPQRSPVRGDIHFGEAHCERGQLQPIHGRQVIHPSDGLCARNPELLTQGDQGQDTGCKVLCIKPR